MEQRFQSEQENSVKADTHPSLAAEVGRDHAISLAPKPLNVEAERDRLMLRQLIRKNQKRVSRAAWFAPVMCSLILLTVLGIGEMAVTSPSFYLPVLLSVIGVVSILFLSDIRFLKQCRPICRDVIKQDDIQTVGLLVDSLQMNYGAINQMVTHSLIELLPRLQSDDAELLNTAQRALLRSKLSSIPQRPTTNRPTAQAEYSTAISFRIAILEAFAQVGDSAALPIVERLARREGQTAEQRRLQLAALECLPALKLRAEQERSHQTLLRAASSVDPRGNTLLRAATNAPEAHPEELLRPGSHTP